MKCAAVLCLILSCVTTTVLGSDLRVTKNAEAVQSFPFEGGVFVPQPLFPGNGLLFGILVENRGSIAASNVSVTDVLPADIRFNRVIQTDGWACTTPLSGSLGGTVTCTFIAIPAGASRSFLIDTTVPADLPTPRTIVNTATVTASTVDPNPADNISTASIEVQPRPIPSLGFYGLIVLGIALAVIALRSM